MRSLLRGLQHVVERLEPGWDRRLHRSQHRSQCPGHVLERHRAVFQARRRGQREQLNEEKVDLVAVRRRFLFLVKVVQQKSLQQLGRDQGGGLQELAQLVNLDALVHFPQPLPGLLHRFPGRLFDAHFEIVARGEVDDELARQRGVRRIQNAGGVPLGGQLIQVGHGLSIQSGTSPRAGGEVRPLWYCRATRNACASARSIGGMQPQGFGKLQGRADTDRTFKVNLEAVTGSPLPGLKEFVREPPGPLYEVADARQKPKRKLEGRTGK